MQQEAKIDDSAFSPSFSCYSSESLKTSSAAAKVIREEQAAKARFYEFENEDFEFSYNLKVWTVFPVFNRDLLVKYSKDDVFAADPLLNLLVVEQPEESSSSCSSSEADELENQPSKTFCLWRPRVYGRSSPKCKKSNSNNSGSKRGIIHYLFGRSNSEGKDPNVLLAPKQKRNSGEISKVTERLNSGIHEQFYVQRRAENEIIKRKSYLPYRQDLVGLFVSAKGIGKMPSH